MKVREIVNLLELKGMPLTKEQRAALENEGHRKMREIRSEMRDVVGSTFKVDKDSIERAAKENVAIHLAEVLAEKRVEKLVTDLILRNMPPAKTIEGIVKEQLLIAAGIVAKEQIAQNVHITFNEAGKYNEGGSF